MFLRNWDNIQAIKLVGAVETINPGIWGNASRTLKDYAGNITAGVMSYFNMKYYSFTYYSTEYAAIGSADISSLKISGAWNTALGAEELAGRNIGICYSYGGIIAVGSGTAAVNYNDYTLNDITDLTHVAYNYSTFLRNDAGKWTGFVCRTLKNETAAAITVTEVGIYLPLFYANGNATDTAALSVSACGSVYLVWRELLPEPVTLSPGKSYNFAVNFELPTND